MTVGRPKKAFSARFHQIPIVNDNGIMLKEISIQIRCPLCKSEIVSTNGTRKTMKAREIIYQCKNPGCTPRTNTKRGKQFSVYTSYCFVRYTDDVIGELKDKIMHSSTTHTNIAIDYCLSPSSITNLLRKFEKYVKDVIGLDKLLFMKENEEALAIDETFIKIKGIDYYVIMATGYNSHKVLGLSVSSSRKEADLLKVLTEADHNVTSSLSVVSADAWGATQSMILNLGRPMTFIIHKHKKPYDKAVIWRIEYDNSNRIITQIGIKTDIFKKKGKREIRVTQEIIPLVQAPKQKRGRPKGSKNKTSPGATKVKKKKQKRGRKGIFEVFNIGTKYFARMDPYRNRIHLSPAVPPSVNKGLQDALNLFSHKHVQNNLSENKNSSIKTYITWNGPKTQESFDEHLHSGVIYDNNRDYINLEISHRFTSETICKQIYRSKMHHFL